ncbi:MAG: hypothetical protein ACQSGP_17530 [Frankia sp.]
MPIKECLLAAPAEGRSSREKLPVVHLFDDPIEAHCFDQHVTGYPTV